MISKVSLRNFKCYREAELDFAPLTVFAGMNAVGKSTALQALLFMRQVFFCHRDGDAAIPINGRLVSFGQADDLIYAYGREGDAQNILSVSVDFSNGIEKAVFEGERKNVGGGGGIVQKQDLAVCRFLGMSRSMPLFSDQFCYLAADRVGPRMNFKSPSSEEARLNWIGNQGEFCVWQLASHKLDKLKILELCAKENGIVADSLIQQVSAWMGKMGRALRVTADMNERQQSAWLSFSFLEGENGFGIDYRPTNVGFGLTYSLPIFVALLSMPKGGVALIENPEAHLHPKGQVVMGEFLSKVAASGVQIVMETHSDHILNGIRLAVKHKVLGDSAVRLNFVAKGSSERDVEMVSPRILPSGSIDIWPEGFFDEYENTIAELI